MKTEIQSKLSSSKGLKSFSIGLEDAKASELEDITEIQVPETSASTSSTPEPKSAPSKGAKTLHYVFIVNGQKLKHWEEVSPRLTKQLRSIKWNVYVTEGPGHATSLAEESARAGADLIAAVGGDGTLNEVVDGVMRSGMVDEEGTSLPTVTVLPLGTNSNFHKSMCWDPKDFERSMWRIGHGSLALLDVARIECDSPTGVVQRHFMNCASCGASAVGALKVDKWRWLGQNMSSRVASALGFMSFTKQPVAVRVDGGNWVKVPAASMVAVGNGSYFANGLKIAPGADPYDGTLKVVTARKLGLWKFLVKTGQHAWGTHLEHRQFNSYDCSKVEVVPLSGKGQMMTTLRLPIDLDLSDAGSSDSPRGVDSPSRTSSTTTTSTDDMDDIAVHAGMMLNTPSSRGATPSPASSPHQANKKLTPSPTKSKSGKIRRRYVPTQTPLAKNKTWTKSGVVPVECDGEVVGNLPFTVEVLPKAIKFMI